MLIEKKALTFALLSVEMYILFAQPASSCERLDPAVHEHTRKKDISAFVFWSALSVSVW